MVLCLSRRFDGRLRRSWGRAIDNCRSAALIVTSGGLVALVVVRPTLFVCSALLPGAREVSVLGVSVEVLASVLSLLPGCSTDSLSTVFDSLLKCTKTHVRPL